MKDHMSWLPSLVNGIQTLFMGSDRANASRMDSAIEDIREAMLEALDVTGSVPASKLELKVTNATDLQDLWYLRGDIMATIAAVDGEATARCRLDHISDMFKGLLPKALTSRPSNLGC